VKLETNQAFLAALQKSRLLTAEQLTLLSKLEADGSSLSAIACELTRREWLTPWQVQQVQSGRTKFRLGSYTLIDVVGRGKMGVVYKARHAETQQIVAIKMMAVEIARDRRKSARFLREIRLVSALQSPHAVLALDAGCFADRHFLVTEFIPGRNLMQWIELQERMPVGWACECARQAAVGLQHIHERGLIHRDLKPSNLMVTADSVHAIPHVRILDLGLGRFTMAADEGGDLTSAGHTVGTIDYMAPEQIKNGREADIRSDIYSLGCTLFQSLSRRLPFEGANIGDTIIAKFATEPPRLEAYRNDIPHELSKLVARMMRREPNERPPVPIDVAEALLPFSVVSRSEAGQSAGVTAVAPDFFESVQTMHQGHLDRRRQRQQAGSTQHYADWLWRFWKSLNFDRLLSSRNARRRRQVRFRDETDDPTLSAS
jgi:serine/threonine protein kinase